MSPAGSAASANEASTVEGTRVESGRFRARPEGRERRGTAWGAIDFAPATAIADSLLYEERLLRVIRPLPSLRLRRGVLEPRGWIESRGADAAEREGFFVCADPWWNRTECLSEADLDARMEVRLRYLQFSAEERAEYPSVVFRREATVAFTLGEVVGSGIVVTVDGGDQLQGRFLVSACMPPSPFQLYRVSVRVENAVRVEPGDRTMTPHDA